MADRGPHLAPSSYCGLSYKQVGVVNKQASPPDYTMRYLTVLLPHYMFIKTIIYVDPKYRWILIYINFHTSFTSFHYYNIANDLINHFR